MAQILRNAGGRNRTRALASPSGLTQNAATFAQRLSQDTGLNKAVIYGWITAETSGWDTTNGPNNWLNVGSFDSGFVDGNSNVWDSPITAADATAAFMTGSPVHNVNSPVGPASSSIQAILQTVGQPPGVQTEAIQNSDWASSHYGYGLSSDVEKFLGRRLTIVGNGPNGGRVRPGGSGATSATDTGSGTGNVVDLASYLSSDESRTAPATAEDVSLGGPISGVMAPFNWFWNVASDEWKVFRSGVTDVVHGADAIDDAALEAVKIMELLPWYFLRFCEFITGMIFMGIGFWMAVRPSGSHRGGVVSNLVAASPLGEFSRIRRATRLGSREGQAEHYRLAARRSAREREAAKQTQRQGQRARASRQPSN